MGDYNFHGLNPRDFQHLVQAIARKAIASGVTAYGDGRDGARDLTFRGKMDFPSVAASWDGYLIVGCKFQQKPTGNPSKDGQWAVSQLEGDFKKYSAKKYKLRKPEYYIFVSNVALSAVGEKGYRDQIEQRLKNQGRELGLKDARVWDYNDLRGFLDGDVDLRFAYGHFITAGDVLSIVAQQILHGAGANFVELMHVYLQKELLSDVAAKLLASGDDVEAQVPLASVFVDLPFAENSEKANAIHRRPDELPFVVESLLHVGGKVLRPSATELSIAEKKRMPESYTSSRFAIVGGPGQGKSTFGQYLCQLYRAALLSDRPSHLLESRVRATVSQLRKQQEVFGGLPVARRFPLRIELRVFSHALLNDSSLTLFEFIRKDISRLANTTIPAEQLKKWLTSYPWLLVLDGLDEVPPSSNRSAVMKEIDSFEIDCTSANSDMLVVATTRPQSYSEEFAQRTFRHLYLASLSPREALAYGRKLVDARAGADTRRRDELVRSLEKACNNQATSRLMQSPLQVTIMAILLEDTGEPPQQKYRLFAEYYRTIYRRETRRKLLGGILSERQKDIDTIHAHAGLVLHANGESGSNKGNNASPDTGESSLSDSQFREITKHRLDQIGVTGAKATELLDRITDGSLQRLVFLVRQTDGWVRFDLASLKEFMAAEAIMTGSDELVRERIKAIAAASYWRNVFQFAVGKCFVEKEHLLDNLVSLCIGLNEEKPSETMLAEGSVAKAAKAVLWGSRVAIDVLADGTARQYPGYEVRFARIALKLICQFDHDAIVRLASTYHDDIRKLYEEEIDAHLGHSEPRLRAGAFLLLAGLANRGVRWASDKLVKNWPADVDIQAGILFNRGVNEHERWSLSVMEERFVDFAPAWVAHFRARTSQLIRRQQYPRLHDVTSILEDRGRKKLGAARIPNRSWSSRLVPMTFVVSTHPNTAAFDAIKCMQFVHSGWKPLVAGVEFAARPTSETLAEVLATLAESWDPAVENIGWCIPLPWPLAACIGRCASRADLLQISQKASGGDFGGIEHWKEQERRCIEHGIVDADFELHSDELKPWESYLTGSGPQFAIVDPASADNKAVASALPAMVDRLEHLPNPFAREWISSCLLQWTAFSPEQSGITQAQFLSLLRMAHARAHRRSNPYALDIVNYVLDKQQITTDWIDVLNWIGENLTGLTVRQASPLLCKEVVKHFNADPTNRRGLLSVICEYAIAGLRCEVAEDSVQQAKTWNNVARWQTLAIQLAVGERTQSDIWSITNDVVSCPGFSDRRAWELQRMAGTISARQQIEVSLALQSLDFNNDATRFKVLNGARSHLVERLTQRPSALHSAENWAKLGLPPRM